MPSFSDSFNARTKTAMYALMDDALWIQQAMPGISIKVEFTNEPLKDELGNIITIDNPTASIFMDDVIGIAAGDALAVQDAQYKIIEIIPTGDGMQDCYLRELD